MYAARVKFFARGYTLYFGAFTISCKRLALYIINDDNRYREDITAVILFRWGRDEGWKFNYEKILKIYYTLYDIT